MIVIGDADWFEKQFLSWFPNSAAHDLDTLLGMDVYQDSHQINLNQMKLISKGLDMLNMTDCKAVKTPITVGVQLKEATLEEQEDFKKLNINYWAYTSLLNYLACWTRPDLASKVSTLSQFNNKTGIKYWKEVIHCWKYLARTRSLRLKLCPTKSSNSLQFYTNSTWEDDLETRIFLIGSICFWRSCPIAWNSMKQSNITLSSTEAELSALSNSFQENNWIQHLISKIWNEESKPTTFHINNQGNGKIKKLWFEFKEKTSRYQNEMAKESIL